jgi:putative endonuclease
LDFFVYILKCSDGTYYTGHTDSIEKRISEHESRLIDGYTATRLPVQLVFIQAFASRDEAFNAERKIKGWSRKKKQALIKQEWETIKKYAND